MLIINGATINILKQKKQFSTLANGIINHTGHVRDVNQILYLVVI